MDSTACMCLGERCLVLLMLSVDSGLILESSSDQTSLFFYQKIQ